MITLVVDKCSRKQPKFYSAFSLDHKVVESYTGPLSIVRDSLCNIRAICTLEILSNSTKRHTSYLIKFQILQNGIAEMRCTWTGEDIGSKGI
jgi:hypothetical protein